MAPRGAGRGAKQRRILRVHHQERIQAREHQQRLRKSALDTGGNSLTPESHMNALKPNTPACWRCRSSLALPGNNASEETDVHRALAEGHLALFPQRLDGGRGRDAVERHVDQRGHSSGRGSLGGEGESSPNPPAPAH
jgi:hypothetical protein